MTDSEGGYPKEFYALILSSITIFLASETARPILPLHITDMGATLVELGLIIGIMSIALIGTKIPLGILAERVSPRMIIVGSALAQSASQLCYSLAPDLVWFYPIRILHAISIAPIVPLAIGRAQEFAPAGKTGETLGTFLTSYGVAITFGPFLCSSLLTQLSYVQVFQFISVIPILGILPFFTGMRFTLFEESNNDAPPVAHAFSHIIHSRNLIILTVLRLMFALAYGFFVTYFIVYAEETILLAPFLIAFLLGVRGAVDMGLRIPVGKLVDRVDPKYFIISGFSILAVAYYLLSEVTDFYLLIGLMALYGVALGLRVVAEWTMVANNSPDGCRSVIAAYLSTLFNIGSGFGAIIGGVLATYLVIPDLFRISSVLMIVAVFITFLIQKKEDVSFAGNGRADDSVGEEYE
ncbi:MAG: MFS transporter [Candidatus Thorarchaeota archaeon]|jgi:predicted MFS family arabinose efflux permease